MLRLVVAALLAVALIGCSADGDDATLDTDPPNPLTTDPAERRDVPVSPACSDAMATAAAEPDLERSTPLIKATLSACGSLDEWLTALRQHPAALALTGPEFVDGTEVQSSCGPPGAPERTTHVCSEAEQRGIL